METVLVTGGAGYIGCVLVSKLTAKYRVLVLDALWFGREGIEAAAPDATLFVGDLRDSELVERLLREQSVDAVIHLAAVSNDPCSELDAELTRSVNLTATVGLMTAAKRCGVRRFVNASSASVYGIKETADVTEELELEPLTLYARYKAETETILNALVDDSFCGVSVRAATVCGLSPRLRLDLTINILAYHGLLKGEIRVFGGEQKRPNIHVQDLTDFYVALLQHEVAKIQGQAFNVVTSNATVMELAHMVQREIGGNLGIKVVPTDDNRSYHLSAGLAQRELGFAPKYLLAETVSELRNAFADGTIKDPHDYIHRNVEVMKRHPERCVWRG